MSDSSAPLKPAHVPFRTRTSWSAGALLMVAMVLTGCGRKKEPFVLMEPPPGEAARAELPKHWALSEFALTERNGQSVSLADLRGKVWVADFFYTTCPGPCPMMTSRLSALQEKLRGKDDVRLVSISTDPAKDTPEVLQQYAANFKAGEHWLFLTGDKAEIFQLANQGFKISVVEERNSPEPVTHSTKLVLVDRAGFVRGFYEGVGEDQSEKLLRDIDRLRAEQP